MKILNYKYLNEQSIYDQSRSTSKVTGIGQKDIRRLVGANLKRNVRIGKIPSVNAFRGLGFSFVTQQSYNDFLTSNNASVLEVYNQLLYTFAILYEGDDCYLYPYTRQSLTLESMKNVTSYLKLELYSRVNQGVKENIQQYFSQFNPKRTNENENNVKEYKLTVLPNFEQINQTYRIPIEVQNLKNFETPSEPMFLSINSVSKEYAINTAYGQQQNKYYTLGIEFTPIQSQLQGISSGTINADPYKSFNDVFKGFTEMTLREQNTPTRNMPQALSNYRYMSIFVPKNGSRQFIIYTDKKLSVSYISTITGQKIRCVIGRTASEFYMAEMEVIDIN